MQEPWGFDWLFRTDKPLQDATDEQRRQRDAKRVTVVNELIHFTCKVLTRAHQKGIRWSLENPRGSLLWILEPVQELMRLEGIHCTDMQMCMHGGARDVWIRLRSNILALRSLSLKCDRWFGPRRHVD